MLRFQHWPILHLQKIEILLNILTLHSLGTQRHPVLPQFYTLFTPLLFRGVPVSLDIDAAQTDIHQQLAVAHAQLEIDVVPVLNEMP